MYMQIVNANGIAKFVIRSSDNASVPFDHANTDSQQFKSEKDAEMLRQN